MIASTRVVTPLPRTAIVYLWTVIAILIVIGITAYIYNSLH